MRNLPVTALTASEERSIVAAELHARLSRAGRSGPALVEAARPLRSVGSTIGTGAQPAKHRITAAQEATP